jgi:hypothetical protein
LLQDIEKMSQIEATLQQELQVRQVKCECAWCKNHKNLFVSGAGAKTGTLSKIWKSD